MLVHYVAIVTYGLALFFLMLSMYLAINKNQIILSYLALLIAASVRLSIFFAVPITIVYFFVRSENKKQTFFSILSVTFLFFIVVFFPFIYKSYDMFSYNIVGSHITVIPFVVRLQGIAHTFFVNMKEMTIFALIFFSSFIYLIKTKTEYKREMLFLLSIVLAVFIIHLFPVNAGSYYNVLLFPILFVISGSIFSEVLKNKKHIIPGLIIITMFFMINLTEQIKLVQKHRLIQSYKPIEKINQVAGYIKQELKKDEILLSFNTLIAVQSNAILPTEFAEDCFSYKGDWSIDKCKKYKRVNNEIFMDYVSDEGIRLIALGDFDLHQFGPDKKNILKKMEKEGFVFAKKFENFGQWHDNLYIFTRK